MYEYTRLAYGFMQVMKRGSSVPTPNEVGVAGWILHFVQDDMDVASWYATYNCVRFYVLIL